MQTWLLLHYKIPSQPTARRVYVWRKLKRLGALAQHDAVWILPANSRTREQFQWLASEIVEMRGEALLWESQLVMPEQELALVQQFIAQADAGYLEILSALRRKKPDLASLARRYQQAQLGDYFRSPRGNKVRAALVSARSGEPQ